MPTPLINDANSSNDRPLPLSNNISQKDSMSSSNAVYKESSNLPPKIKYLMLLYDSNAFKSIQ